MKSKSVVFVVCSLALMLGPLAPATAAGEPETPPNIVVIYMDDVSPHHGAPKRLWEDPLLTPTVTNMFVEHGIEFTNAIGETSLCCPGRGSLLTGQHTFNHGVLMNDGRLFNPGEHIGQALKDAGYATMFIGKYLNNVNQYSPADWTRDGKGWTYLDVINGRNGDFTKYNLHTKTGTIRYGTTHSTRMVAERAVMHIGEVPSNKPLFAVLSVYNMHGPNMPLPEFKHDPRCSNFPPFLTPNYNEADVSDKPPSISTLPLLPNVNGWPMVTYCREMLGIDWMVKQVTDALAAEGRLDNTLMVFTADNGSAWGAHRAGQRKSLPYTTPVPLYFWFPERWGDEPRKLDDLVVNIDLAPTFCAVAGNACHLGPYPGGQAGPDGRNMLPLVEGPPVTWRSAALEDHFLGPNSEDPSFTAWRAVRTDDTNPLGAWHYVEWGNGFRELYDLEADPWELENKTDDPTLAATKGLLAAALEALWQEGRPDVDATRPDAVIGKTSGGVMYGSHLYASTAASAQLSKYKPVPTTTSRNFFAQIINRSSDFASFTVNATSTGNSAMTVQYFRNGIDVTADVTGAGLVVPNVRPGNHISFTIKISAVNALPKTSRTAVLYARNTATPDQVDVVRAIMSR